MRSRSALAKREKLREKCGRAPAPGVSPERDMLDVALLRGQIKELSALAKIFEVGLSSPADVEDGNALLITEP